MCDPVSAAIAVVGTGTLVSATGAMQEAEANNAANEYNAQLAEANAELAELDAQWVEKVGEANVASFKRDLEELKSSQRASFGASGAVVDKGSTLDVLKDTAARGAIDALTIQRNSEKEAWNIRQQGRNYRGQAALSRLGYQDPDQAFGMTLLSGGSQLAGSYLLSRR